MIRIEEIITDSTAAAIIQYQQTEPARKPNQRNRIDTLTENV